MKFKVGDVVEDRRYPTIKTVGVVTRINEYTNETFINVAAVSVSPVGTKMDSRMTFRPESLTLLIPATTIDMLESRGESWSSSVFSPEQVDQLVKNGVIGK